MLAREGGVAGGWLPGETRLSIGGGAAVACDKVERSEAGYGEAGKGAGR